MSLDGKILERIESENLRIRPRWFFAMKDVLLGTATFLLSIFGSLSLALLFEIMKQYGGDLAWLNVSYAWVALFGVFLMASYWLVIKIDSLYKIKFAPIISMLFFISLSFGYLTFASGQAKKIELELEKIPAYDAIMPIKKEIPLNLDIIEKTELSNGNMDVDVENNKNEDEIVDNKKSVDSDDDGNVATQGRNNNVEIKDKNGDGDEYDEIEKSEKTSNIDKDEDDSVKGEVKGVSKEAIKGNDKEEEIEEIEKEKPDSDDDTASLEEESSEKSESDSAEIAEED